MLKNCFANILFAEPLENIQIYLGDLVPEIVRDLLCWMYRGDLCSARSFNYEKISRKQLLDSITTENEVKPREQSRGAEIKCNFSQEDDAFELISHASEIFVLSVSLSFFCARIYIAKVERVKEGRGEGREFSFEFHRYGGKSVFGSIGDGFIKSRLWLTFNISLCM